MVIKAQEILNDPMKQSSSLEINFLKELHEFYNGERQPLVEFIMGLRVLPIKSLQLMGMQVWSFEDDERGRKPKDQVLMLFPKEWYDYIPDRYVVTDIFYEDEYFEKGKTDSDTRFGALSFGIYVKYTELEYKYHHSNE